MFSVLRSEHDEVNKQDNSGLAAQPCHRQLAGGSGHIAFRIGADVQIG